MSGGRGRGRMVLSVNTLVILLRPRLYLLNYLPSSPLAQEMHGASCLYLTCVVEVCQSWLGYRGWVWWALGLFSRMILAVPSFEICNVASYLNLPPVQFEDKLSSLGLFLTYILESSSIYVITSGTGHYNNKMYVLLVLQHRTVMTKSDRYCFPRGVHLTKNEQHLKYKQTYSRALLVRM